MQGSVHSIETFGSVDGPGVRFVIFFSGCELRCRYCHNADTWDMSKGKTTEAKELIEKALRYKSYWGKDGGITVSGGEPLLQIDFITELFSMAKEHAINTCIDTAAQPFTRKEPFFSKFNELMKLTDLLLMDIKHIDNSEHIKLTGKPNDNILDCMRYLSEIHKPVWIRQVLVPGITDNDEQLEKAGEFISSLSNVKKVEVLPYHSLGQYKWEKLGLCYPLADVQPPKKDRIENAERLLGCDRYR